MNVNMGIMNINERTEDEGSYIFENIITRAHIKRMNEYMNMDGWMDAWMRG